MRRFPVKVQQVIDTSDLAVQKSQANRNSGRSIIIQSSDLAVQKSQANRNALDDPTSLARDLAVQKSQANRNGRTTMAPTGRAIVVLALRAGLARFVAGYHGC
jgi:hypothetical protein